MNRLKKQLIILLSLCGSICFAQRGFHFQNPNKNLETVKFKLISNLIVVPISFNGIELTFIVDSGANNTFLFNITGKDSLDIKNIHQLSLNGLGSEKPVKALLSRKNELKIGGIVHSNLNIFLVLDQDINFSPKLGIPIHGIIGCNLFNNFITEIKYSSKTLKFYRPEFYKHKRTRKYETFDLDINKNRLFINAEVQLDSVHTKTVRLLLDSGSSDAVWLLENAKKGIRVPENSFRDYMGQGIGGSIHGSRSRLQKISLGSFNLENTKISYPDSVDVALAYNQKNREGSIGGGILKRFNIVLDYPSKKIHLKKNNLFKRPFEYNMSGMNVEHKGVKPITTFNPNIGFSKLNKEGVNSTTTFSINNMYKTRLLPIYEITDVRENTPAALAGVLKGDILLAINNKKAQNLKLENIIELLSSKNGEKIKLRVERNRELLKFEFNLKRLL